jgi:hypothetical protein
MESRVATLEQIARTTAATLERIELRFDAIDQRFDLIDRRFDAIDSRFEVIDRRFDAVDMRFDGIDKRLDGIDKRLDTADRRFESVDRRIDVLVAGRQADFRWILGVMFAGFSATIGGFATMLGVMAHGFHWL